MDDKLLMMNQFYYLILKSFKTEGTTLGASNTATTLRENEPLWQNVGKKDGKNYKAIIRGHMSDLSRGPGALSMVAKHDSENIYMRGPKTRYDNTLANSAIDTLMGLGFELENSLAFCKDTLIEPEYSYLRKEKSILTTEQLHELAVQYGCILYYGKKDGRK